MTLINIKASIRKNISNIPGWRTKKHIVVIESDDWGSIRMSSKQAFNNLIKNGMREDLNHYNTFDALESNTDIEELMNLLSKFRDSSGRYPVITGVNIVANPVFDKIRQSEFTEYYYEPFTETCKRYPNHDKVYSLWQTAQSERLIIPVFHGREHLNVQRWLRALKSGNKSVHIAFDNSITGIYNGINNEPVPDFQAAFDIDTMNDIHYQRYVITSGLDLFEQLYGRRARFFVPTNGPFNNKLELTLDQYGIKYINSAKKQLEPLGNNHYQTNTRFLGTKNSLGQIYLTRNCSFEPSANGFVFPTSYDWVDRCLREIKIAFRWNKPATISSHRVNYIGWLNPQNRSKSLTLLNKLLSSIIKNWPDVEFYTSEELGDLIKSNNHEIIH